MRAFTCVRLLVKNTNKGEGQKSLEDIADQFHLTRERVRQIKEQALRPAKKYVAKQVIEVVSGLNC
jgi:DNA-directed RNA polymerase sigma subunit (sigma70/sigma32)